MPPSPSIKLPAALSSKVEDLFDLDTPQDDALWTLYTWSLTKWISKGATWYQVKDMLKMVYPKDNKNRIQSKLLNMMTEMQNPEYVTNSSKMFAYFPMHVKVYNDIEKLCVDEKPWDSSYRYSEWLAKHIFKENASNLAPRNDEES